jgi:hypothetical protein
VTTILDIAEHITFSAMEVLIQAIYILENHFIKNTITLKHHTDHMLKTKCGKITFLAVNNCLQKCRVIQLPHLSGQDQTAFEASSKE